MHVHIVRAHMLVMGASVRLAGVIAQVFTARAIYKLEDALLLAVEQPKRSHLHLVRLLPFIGIINNTNNGRIVDGDRGGGLGMAQLL